MASIPDEHILSVEWNRGAEGVEFDSRYWIPIQPGELIEEGAFYTGVKLPGMIAHLEGASLLRASKQAPVFLTFPEKKFPILLACKVFPYSDPRRLERQWIVSMLYETQMVHFFDDSLTHKMVVR